MNEDDDLKCGGFDVTQTFANDAALNVFSQCFARLTKESKWLPVPVTSIPVESEGDAKLLHRGMPRSSYQRGENLMKKP